MKTLSLLLFFFVFACKIQKNSDGAQVKNLPAPGETLKYQYFGPLDTLIEPTLFVSIDGSTLRVQGWLPPSYDMRRLPVYAYPDMEDARKGTRIQIVYPIATAEMGDMDREANLTHGKPFDKASISPWDGNYQWGGFPFISFNPGYPGLYGFHGPITGEHGEIPPVSGHWQLIRGAVSHGCHRMQGEHVTELAHLLGADMKDANKVAGYHAGSKEPTRPGYRLFIQKAYDQIEDGAFAKKFVDVNYEKSFGVEPAPKNTMVFETWDALDTAFVCPLNRSAPCKEFQKIYKRAVLEVGSENLGNWTCSEKLADKCVKNLGFQWTSKVDKEGRRSFRLSNLKDTMLPGTKVCRWTKDGQAYYKTGRGENAISSNGEKLLQSLF